MREILFRGKRVDNGEWVEGYYSNLGGNSPRILKENIFIGKRGRVLEFENIKVLPETVGQFTGLTDKNGRRIFEGDIVQYNIYDDFDCQSVVKFGEYNQDGSAGEYSVRECIGFYVDVDNFTCPDWCENDPDYFPKHFKQQNVLEVARDCQVIGNIHDNPELLEVGDNNE